MAERRSPNLPGAITSIGALSGLVLAFFGYASGQGELREAQRRSEIAEARIEQHANETQRRLWDALGDLRREQKDELRHEVQVGCNCRGAGQGEP